MKCEVSTDKIFKHHDINNPIIIMHCSLILAEGVLGEGKVLEGGGQVGARMCIWEVWKSRRIEGHLLAKAAAEASA